MTYRHVAFIVDAPTADDASHIVRALFADGNSQWATHTGWDDTNVLGVFLASSPDGRRVLSQALDYMRRDWVRNMTAILDTIHTAQDRGMSLDQVWDEYTTTETLRYRLHECGEYEGSSVLIYGGNGEGIVNQAELTRELAAPIPPGDDRWVVWVNAHW